MLLSCRKSLARAGGGRGGFNTSSGVVSPSVLSDETGAGAGVSVPSVALHRATRGLISSEQPQEVSALPIRESSLETSSRQ